MKEPVTVRVYQASIGTLGALLMVLLAPAIASAPGWSLLFLTLLYLFFSQFIVILPSGVRVSAAFPIAVTAIVAHGPAAAMWITLPAVVSYIWTQKFSLLRTFFNIGHFALSIGVGGAIFRVVGGTYGRIVLPYDFIPLILTALGADLANILMVATRVALLERHRVLPVVYRTIRERKSATLLYHVLAVTMALLYVDRGPYGALVASASLVGLNRYFRVIHEVEEVRLQAVTDRLTRVYNYRFFADWLENSFPALTRLGEPVSVLFVDINDLKIFNDTYGHHAGDLALQQVARVLQSYTRNTDRVVRYGGDEFVVILPKTDTKSAERIAERIRDLLVESRVFIGDREVPVEISIGVSTYPVDTDVPEELVKVADRAMYLAKSKGANIICNAGQLSAKN